MENIPAIHTPERRLILYADLGGQVADVISGHIPDGSRVIIQTHQSTEKQLLNKL